MKRIAVMLSLALFLAAMVDGALRAQSPAWIYLGYQQQNVALPGTAVVVRYYVRNDLAPRDRAVRLFRVPLNVRLDWVRQYRGQLSEDELRNLELVRVLLPAQTRGEEYTLHAADFGSLPSDEYLAVWDNGIGRSARFYEVETLGSVWHAAGRTLLVYAVDLKTMKHRNDVQYSLWRPNGSHVGMVTLGGLAWLHSGDYEGAILYGRASDGSRTVQRLWQNYPSGNAAYIQTDRPIYRTGQRVHLRAVIRDGVIGNYIVPHGAARVIVRSPDGTPIYDRKCTLTSFGSLATDLEIPQSARLGYYQITVGTVSSGFSVEEYKKPEYLLHAQAGIPYVIGGDPASFAVDAKYFFGRPAAGMTLHYTASLGNYYFQGFDPYAFLGEVYPYRSEAAAFEATGIADAGGHLNVAIPTKRVDREEDLSFQVDGRDASGRTVSTVALARVVPASFRIDLTPKRWFAQLGDEVEIAAVTRDYDARIRPNTRLDVEVRGTRWDSRSHKPSEFPVEKVAVVTDADGRANFRWHPSRAASYQIRCSGSDERANVARSALWFWVSSPGDPWWNPNQPVTLIPDKAEYKPGERAKLLLSAPQAGADGVLIVTSDRIQSARMLHIGSQAQTLTIDPPKDASYFRVRVEIPGKDGLASADTGLRVTPAPRLLRVTLIPNKLKYAPGERAVFGVRVRNVHGTGVRADLGIGIVDEALYAVQEDRSAGAMGQFYDNRSLYVSAGPSWQRVDSEMAAPPPSPPGMREIASVSSRPRDYVMAGTTSDVYSVNAPKGQGVALRTYFPDTAYWNPDVVTDAGGNATLAFNWPDTLTTWRATGVAVDMDTGTGSGTQDAFVSKDFLVRLEMPRFLRRGDRSQFTGIVNGKAGTKSALLRLDAGDLMGSEAPAQTIAIDSNASGNAAWSVTPLTSLGDRDVSLTGSDGTLSDAMRLTIPIEAAGAAEHLRDAGEAHVRSSIALSLPALYDSGSLHITLSPSIVAQLLQNVRLLDVYPYYCTEQTMSAALPAVFLDRVFKRTGVSLPADSPRTASIVKKAVARLGELQHVDGSWGWWEHDDAHPFMTAYALYGLAEFRKSGYAVPQSMYDAGIASVRKQLQGNNDDTLRLWGGRQPGSQWNTRAFMLFALADAAPEGVNRTILDQTMRNAGDLNDYALAVLGLAQHELGNNAAARTLLDRLNAHMLETASDAYWLGQTWHYAWQDDPIETTAYALRLNDTLDPGSARAGKIVNFLRSQEHGDWWYTTKDTAAAVYAIAQSEMPAASEFHPNELLDIYVGEKLVRHLHITKSVLEQAAASLLVSPADLQSGGTVRFAVRGAGALYWSTDWTRYAPPYARRVRDAEESVLSRLRAQPPSFSIDRKYEAKRWPWQVGDEVTVQTTVRVAADTDYVAIEDPFPAGAEYQPLQGDAGDDWSGLQFFDDRVVFFADRLYARYPIRLRYTLRVTTPGTYTASPPVAYAMYGPPVSTVGQPDKVTIR